MRKAFLWLTPLLLGTGLIISCRSVSFMPTPRLTTPLVSTTISSTPFPTVPPHRLPALEPGIQLLASLAIDKVVLDWKHTYLFTWSADGKSVAFVSDGAMWIATEPDFVPEMLVNTIPYVGQPVWSPNGRRIAFVGTRQGEGAQPNSVWVVNTDGSDLRDILPKDRKHTVGWKRLVINCWLDEKTLVLDDHRGTAAEAMITVNVDTGKITDWTIEKGIYGVNFYWSPVREHLAVETDRDIYLIDVANGSKISLIPEWPSLQSFPVWAPDGEALLYTQSVVTKDRYWPVVEQPPSLYLWNIGQSEGHQLLPNTYRAVWSPSGERIAFFLLGTPTYDEGGRIKDTDFNPGQPFDLYFGLLSWPKEEVIILMPVRQELRFASYNEAWYWFDRRIPIWTPDGKQVVYWGPDDELWIMRADGTEQKRLTQGFAGVYNLDSYPYPDLPLASAVAWSPDCTKLAIATTDKLLIIKRPL
jgi:dipeptidyl aminopeptidase/acylaminoacyl peptidase